MTKTGIVVIVSALLSATAAQAAWTGARTIRTYKMEPGGLMIVLDGFVNDSAVVCTGNDYLYMKASDQNFEVRSATLLAGYLAGQKVNLSFYECGGYSPTAELLKLGSISLSSSP